MSKLSHIKKPCLDCPFRKDTLQGWLGKDRMTEILAADSFVCHKKTDMQCAGHMLLNAQDNAFVRLADRLGIQLGEPAEFGKNRTLRRPICLRASALKRRVSRASETRAKVQRHRRS